MELKIISGNENNVSIQSIDEEKLPTSLEPFGKQVIQKGKQGRAKVVLKIKGLQQMDLSNIYGVIFIANEKKLKVYYGEGLKLESEIEFENEIKCLKISEFDESLIAIGFGEINELHIYQLVPFVESQLKLEKFEKFEIENSFNQIKWNYQKDNNLLLRCTESSETFFINLEKNEINKDIETAEAICFDLRNNIVVIKNREIIFYENQDLDSPISQDLDQVLPYPLSKIFHIQEYEPNQWIIIGYNRSNVENKDDEDDTEGMSLEFIPCTGDISQQIVSSNKSIDPNSFFQDYGDISKVIQYQNFLEFKLVKIAQNQYCLFQPINEVIMHIVSQENGVYFTEIEEEKIKSFKNQIRGAAFASFQIDNDLSFIKFIDKDNKNYYQFIPPCVITLDSQMNLQKHFICKDLSLNEENKNQPQDQSKRTKKPIQLKKSEILQENYEEEKEIDISDKKTNKTIIQQNNNEISQLQEIKKQLQQQPDTENKNSPPQNNEQKDIQIEVKPEIVNEPKTEKINEQQKMDNSQHIINQEQININKAEESVVEDRKIMLMQINPKEIVYNRDTIKKYLDNFRKFQQKVTEISYSENRSVYNHKVNKKFSERYANTEFSDIKLELGTFLQQPSIHSIEYFFEKDKLLFCTNEQDGLSYIYVLALDQYKQICLQVQSFNEELEKQNQNKNMNLNEKKRIIAEKKKENQEVIFKEIKKYRVFTSSEQIIQIHNIYSYFLAIVFKNGLVIRNLENIIKANEEPKLNDINKKFQFTIKLLIFSRSKKYFIILTEDRQLLVMNTLLQQVLFNKQNVLFANFRFLEENEIIILQQNKTIQYNIINQKQQEFGQFGNLESYKIIHFEEFKPNGFISIQYSDNVINQECNQCNKTGCQQCRQQQLYVFVAKDLNNVNSSSIENNQWNMVSFFQSNCTAKCIYNQQIKQLVSIINQVGTVYILNITEDNQVQIPEPSVPNWLNSLFISGIIYIPFRIFNEDDQYFSYQDENKIQRITYLLPSLLIFNGMFNLNRLYQYDEGKSEQLESNDNQQLISRFSSQNTIITIEQYMILIQGNLDSFTKYPDFYILYEKIEEMSHVLQFLEENNLFDIIEAKFKEDASQIINQQEQQKTQNSKQIEQKQIDQKQIEQKQIEQKQIEQKQSDQKQNEQRLSEQKQKQLQKPQQDAQAEEQTTIALVKYIGNVMKSQANKQLQQTSTYIKSLKNHQPSECIPKNLNISSLSDIKQPQQFQFVNNLKQIIDGFKSELDKIIERNKRLSHEIKDSVFPSKNYQQNINGNQKRIGINQTVNYHDKEVTIFAIKNSLQQSKRNSVNEIKSSSNINLTYYDEIQYLAKFPQKNNNKIHLLAGLTKQQGLFKAAAAQIINTLYHIVIEDEKYQIVQKICEYPNKNIINISVFEDSGEVLVTYSDDTIELIYAKDSSQEATLIHKWQKASFAIFTFIGTVLISFQDRKISEFMALELEEGLDIVEKKCNAFQGIGFSQDVSKIIYMFQYNSSAFVAIGLTQFSLIAYPVLIENFVAIKNSQVLSYTIPIQNIDKTQLQCKAIYCKNMKQLYLTHNLLNEIIVLPMSINNIVHKPQMYSCSVAGIQFINGFFKAKQDTDSTTFEVCDIIKQISKKVTFTKNKNSLFSVID